MYERTPAPCMLQPVHTTTLPSAKSIIVSMKPITVSTKSITVEYEINHIMTRVACVLTRHRHLHRWSLEARRPPGWIYPVRPKNAPPAIPSNLSEPSPVLVIKS